MDRDTG